jgi:hypothetical protein
MNGETGGTCSTNGKLEDHTELWSENLESTATTCKVICDYLTTFSPVQIIQLPVTGNNE